jgi:hypothetical protein
MGSDAVLTSFFAQHAASAILSGHRPGFREPNGAISRAYLGWSRILKGASVS